MIEGRASQWTNKQHVKQSSQCAMQVIDIVIHKYEQGSHGAEVFQEYEKGLHALLAAYTASSLGEHFQIAQQDSSRLEKVCWTLVLCYAMPCHAMQCYAMLSYAALCYAVPSCAVLCCAVLRCAVLCCAASCTFQATFLCDTSKVCACQVPRVD